MSQSAENEPYLSFEANYTLVLYIEPNFTPP